MQSNGFFVTPSIIVKHNRVSKNIAYVPNIQLILYLVGEHVCVNRFCFAFNINNIIF